MSDQPEAVDTSRPGCLKSIHGRHRIEWIDVPAQTWLMDKGRGYRAHRRGVCLACDERFMEEG